MILVTGATGFLGNHLVRELIEGGYKVRALVRDVRRGERLESQGVELVKGDMTDPESLKEATKGIETVINLVGVISGGEKVYRAVHTEGTRKLAEAAKEKGAKRFIYISANGASRDGATPYFRTKWEAEEEVKKSGLEYTIFRPSVLFGPNDAFVNQLAFGMRLSPVFPVFGSGKYKLQPLFVKDLAQCMVKSITEPKAVNQVIEMGGPDAMTFNEIVDAVAEALNKKVYKIHIPLSMIKLSARLMGKILKKPPVSIDQLIMMEMGNVCDTARMKEIFGIKPTPFKEGLRTYIH
ncbi:MAG: complex I NDUFA9 subunit family protein [Deltaproteobacteria bacterium]|nr:complex I NDUFA9 subunit family protein [Deltaproteobacteria bacterium]